MAYLVTERTDFPALWRVKYILCSVFLHQEKPLWWGQQFNYNLRGLKVDRRVKSHKKDSSITDQIKVSINMEDFTSLGKKSKEFSRTYRKWWQRNHLASVQVWNKDNFLNKVWSSYISCIAWLGSLEKQLTVDLLISLLIQFKIDANTHFFSCKFMACIRTSILWGVLLNVILRDWKQPEAQHFELSLQHRISNSKALQQNQYEVSKALWKENSWLILQIIKPDSLDKGVRWRCIGTQLYKHLCPLAGLLFLASLHYQSWYHSAYFFFVLTVWNVTVLGMKLTKANCWRQHHSSLVTNAVVLISMCSSVFEKWQIFIWNWQKTLGILSQTTQAYLPASIPQLREEWIHT